MTDITAAAQNAGESNCTMPPVRWRSTAFSAASIVIIEIMLMPAAVLAAAAHGRRSRPRRSNVVSRRSDVVMPEATHGSKHSSVEFRCIELTRKRHYRCQSKVSMK